MPPFSPWLTVVTPSYQTGPYIERCLDSVATLGDGVEHIVVDGKSTDATHDILRAWSEGGERRIWIDAPDRGQTHAINLALQRATAPVALWINSDDWIVADRHVLQRSATDLLDSEASLASAPMLLVDDRSGRQEIRQPKAWPPWAFVAFGVSTIYTPSVLFRTQGEPRLDERYTDAADYDLWARLALIGGIHRLFVPIGAFLLRPGSKTVDDVGTQLAESHLIRARLIPELPPTRRTLARVFALAADIRVRRYVDAGGLRV